ncbi:MAG: nuclear transport factor 2 family protein [Candidatus Methylomirabilales bacterium]
MKKNPVAIAAGVLAIVVVVWLVYPRSEEDRIRQRLHELAEVVSTTQQHRDAARLIHIAGLKQFFTDDVTVQIKGNIPHVKDRRKLLQMAHVALQQEPNLAVAFEDISVIYDNGTQQAQVNTTVVVTGAHSQRAKSVEAQEMEMDLVKPAGEWLIKAVRPVEVMRLE